MSTVQLTFTLRTSSHCRSVHLIGSWDAYKTSLPLSRDSRAGSWKGTFRFASPALQPGGRYWYYYMTDAANICHDPARPAVVEPTSGRTLNILDIPATDRRHSGVKGRSLSPSRIVHPAPSRPYETQLFRGHAREMEALSAAYAAQRLGDDSSDSERSWSSRSAYSSSPSSVSSLGSPITPTGGSPLLSASGFKGASVGLGISLGAGGECTCQRFAVLKDGRRLRVDCGGRVCGVSSGESSGDSSSDESEHERRHSSRSKGRKHSSSGRNKKTKSKSKRHGFLGWR